MNLFWLSSEIYLFLELQGEQNDTVKHFETANNEALLGTETVAEQ